jgi:hypothetical protein
LPRNRLFSRYEYVLIRLSVSSRIIGGSMDNEELKLPDKSDYQLLFQTCIKDLSFVKDQQWKTVHLTLIALVALLVASKEGIICVFANCFFVFAVTITGLYFLREHQNALIRYREQKETIINAMPDIYRVLHPSKGSNKDIYIFSFTFMVIIASFALYVFLYTIIDF